MYIQLSEDEINYMHKAINEWHKGAFSHILKMKNYKYAEDFDGYDPLPPGKCITLTEARIEQVKSWTTKFDADWKNNEGKIDLDFFCSKILEYSVHKNLQSPILLRIDKKIEDLKAKSDQNVPLQRQGLFAVSPIMIEQKNNSNNPPGGLQIR